MIIRLLHWLIKRTPIIRRIYRYFTYKLYLIEKKKEEQLKLQAEKDMKEFLYTYPKVRFSSQTEESFKTLDCFKRHEGNFLKDLLNENKDKKQKE